MVESNSIKFYMARYFFLAVAVIQWLVAITNLMRFEFNGEVLFSSFIFAALGFLFFLGFLLVNNKIRQVAIGKNKIVVTEGDKNMRFEWPEVKSLKIIPFLNLYKLKIKGKRSIYFFPSKNIDPTFGFMTKDTSKMGSIIGKRKKDFGIS